MHQPTKDPPISPWTNKDFPRTSGKKNIRSNVMRSKRSLPRRAFELCWWMCYWAVRMVDEQQGEGWAPSSVKFWGQRIECFWSYFINKSRYWLSSLSEYHMLVSIQVYIYIPLSICLYLLQENPCFFQRPWKIFHRSIVGCKANWSSWGITRCQRVTGQPTLFLT